jgi:hypothetical protein
MEGDDLILARGARGGGFLDVGGAGRFANEADCGDENS